MTTKRPRRPKTPPPADSLLLTIPETSEALRSSRGTVYNLIKAGRLKVVKLGTSTRITRASAEALAA
jgi:excisionase family DNA binding protein